MKKIFRNTIFSILTIIFVAFSPWITEGVAENRAISAFENKQKGVMDGCGFNCEGCGVIKSTKVAFGYRVEIEYACGLLEADLKEYHQYKTLFVSFLGTVH
ncbi:hypothetical protein H1D32_12070 [Anaerobacillus sp. CMMVII]|uniref:hypothetical protein n=1 Tax=Anaerobacillus sp. CMMVII TaxID=2755588 RepID=UPI0021B78206|nr:hypothetical protein [Anaerobacillus sp. CMMVII]MCT8138416.1 hypothetical protein [Anaerobacillus sp. CMMVII]